MNVDSRQANRSDDAPEAAPPDSIVHAKSPSFWAHYHQAAIAVGAVMLVQAALIAALLVERRRRRRTGAAALAQSEQRMSLAAEAARLSMWTWDTGPAPALVQTPARRSTDLPSHVSTEFRDVLASIHPQDRASVEMAVAKALATREEFDVEYRVLGPDGELRWMAARGRAAEGNGKRLLGVALDITQRKRAELQAEQDRAALRHMTRVSLLGQLSASIAHQLNQPLAAILSNAEAAQKMLQREPVDLPELREICDDIVAENHRAAEVIRRLGALFRRGEPLLEPLDVNQLITDALDLTRTDLLTRHVTLVTRLTPGLPQIDGDRVQLQQLLLNLIVNAADAMAETPEPEREVVITTELRGTDIRVCVADRGPGVAMSDMDKVFDPFWSTKASGMGIGLAICRSIAVAHRGSLTLASAGEGGAVFCALLPVRAGA